MFKQCAIPRWVPIVRTHSPEASKCGSKLVDAIKCDCVTAIFDGDDDVKAYLFNNPIFTGILTSIPFVDLGPLAHGACVHAINGVAKAKTQKEHEFLRL